jgi:hypothetical protein
MAENLVVAGLGTKLEKDVLRPGCCVGQLPGAGHATSFDNAVIIG